MARASAAIRQLAHHLSPHESLGEELCAGSRVREAATGVDRARQYRGLLAGFDNRQGSSRRNRGFKNNGHRAIGKSRGEWTTKIHMVAANARTAITFSLSPGQAHDAPAGRGLLTELGTRSESLHLVMGRAYEDSETHQLVLDLGTTPVVPPKANRIEPWESDRAAVPKAEGFPPHLLPLREARRHIPWLSVPRPHCRSTLSAVSTPYVRGASYGRAGDTEM